MMSEAKNSEIPSNIDVKTSSGGPSDPHVILDPNAITLHSKQRRPTLVHDHTLEYLHDHSFIPVIKDKETGRGNWGNHCEYFLSSLGLAVGLGNIWRFPYVCYENGGGTFLIPYLIMLFLVGLPLFFLELVLGQYSGISATKIYFRMVPGLRGLGYAMVLIPTVINIYYTVIMGYTFYFLFSGFTSQLPWARCQHDFNTEHCFSLEDQSTCNIGQTFYNLTCVPVEKFCLGNELDFNPDNFTHCFVPISGAPVAIRSVTYRTSAAEDFWYRRVLGLQVVNGIVYNEWSHWGSLRWELVGCLGLSWLLICLALLKGIHSYGKLVYFITLFPYLVLTILLIYCGIDLEGFVSGVEFYVTPDWDQITNLSVWRAAAGQIFYSLGIAVGSQLLLSSYNDFKTNCYRDSLLIAIGNSATSIYAGFVVFGVVGFIATRNKVSIEDVITAGPGLTFIVYPEAVAVMKASPFFSFLFFFMLVLLAMSSVCGSWETLIGFLNDQFPSLRKKRVIVMIVSCLLAFLAGIPMCFDSGFFLFQLMDSRSSNSILLMAFLEVICVSWFYGVDRLWGNIQEMGMNPNILAKYFFKFSWLVSAPIIIFVISIFQWSAHQQDSFLQYIYPIGVQAFGWIIELAPLLITLISVIGTTIYKYHKGDSIAFLKVGPMMTPKASWGARDDVDDVDDVVVEIKPNGITNPAFVTTGSSL